MLSYLQVSSVYVLSLVTKWEIYISNCGRHISPTEVTFTKLFHVTLDLIGVYNIYKFQVNHLKNKPDLGHRKSRKMKSISTITGSWRISFWYYKRDHINWYRFNFKIKILKISISTITSCDNWKWGSTCLTHKTSFTSRDLSSLKISSFYL